MSIEISDKSTDPLNPNFCWFKFLNQPESDFSEEDLDNAKILSGEWTTCACGQMCQDLPRWESNAPKDTELSNLGLRFMNRIADARYLYNIGKEAFLHEIKEANSILIKIEKRTKKLLEM
jgi:hypothetical protein